MLLDGREVNVLEKAPAIPNIEQTASTLRLLAITISLGPVQQAWMSWISLDCSLDLSDGSLTHKKEHFLYFSATFEDRDVRGGGQVKCGDLDGVELFSHRLTAIWFGLAFRADAHWC